MGTTIPPFYVMWIYSPSDQEVVKSMFPPLNLRWPYGGLRQKGVDRSGIIPILSLGCTLSWQLLPSLSSASPGQAWARLGLARWNIRDESSEVSQPQLNSFICPIPPCCPEQGDAEGESEKLGVQPIYTRADEPDCQGRTGFCAYG